MSYDPQRPQDPNAPVDPLHPRVPVPEQRTGMPKWIWAALAVVAIFVLFALFSGGGNPDPVAPVGDAGAPAQTDPVAPAPGTPVDSDPAAAPADPAAPAPVVE